jgi:anti-sigma factor RsiW
MKCKHAQDLIELFGELSPAEQSRLENHILHCPTCADALQQVQGNQELVSRAFPVRRLAHPQIFTNRVMSKIGESPVVSSPLGSLNNLLAVFRMTMASVTVILIVFFVHEVQLESKPPFHTSVSPSESAAVLNTQAFLQRLANKPDTKDSFFACVKICRKDADATQCETCQKRIKNISL